MDNAFIEMKKKDYLVHWMIYGLFWTSLWVWLLITSGCTPEPITVCEPIAQNSTGNQVTIVIECITHYAD